MEKTNQLKELNNDVLEKTEAYISSKTSAGDEHHEKIKTAKEKWQAAWNEFLETLLVLEKLEI